MTYIKENIITKLQKLYSPPRNPRVGHKSPVLFVKKPLCMSDLLPPCKIFVERPALCICLLMEKKSLNLKATIKMLTFQKKIVLEVFLIDLVLITLEKYL